MPPTNPIDRAAELRRIQRKLDGDQPRTEPLLVPAWCGPTGDAIPEISISFREGRVLIRMTDSFAEIARQTTGRP